MKNAILQAMKRHPDAGDAYRVPSRGRPERRPEEAARRELRRAAFGRQLRALREAAGLNLSQAARLTGMSSPRKLAQYETTCYPPGDVIVRLAPHYNVPANLLAQLVLKHSDPEMFEAITGETGYNPSRQEIIDQIEQAQA